jgi:molybdopterin adenylyltransferase
MRAAAITISDRSYRGERADASGPDLVELLIAAGATIHERVLIPDDRALIASALARLIEEGCDVIATTGGTGISPRDVTPEATLEVIERRLFGVEQAILLKSMEKTPFAMLSRAIVGVRGRTLILNFPGSPKAVRECFGVVGPLLGHILTLLRDEDPHAAHAARKTA